MAVLPQANTQIIREDDSRFYVSTTSNTLVDVAALRGQMIALCEQALSIGATLRAAAAVEVAEAAAIVSVLNTVAAFSDAEAATTFLAALRATAPE